MLKNYIKKDKKTRKHKITSINLESYQYDTIKELNIDLSKLVRELLEHFLSVNCPDEYFKNKRKIK